jgi:hypothetical protein
VPVQKIGDVIANSGGLSALDRQARELSGLQVLLCDVLPPALAAASRVSGLRAGLLRVSAENAAVAAKLRQFTPRLLVQLRRLGLEVTGIRVEVQVKVNEIKAKHDFAKAPLPPDAIRKFEELADPLRDSPLKQALTRFVARRRDSEPR